MSDFPYAERFAPHHALPEVGEERRDVLAALAAMAAAEDPTWESGQCDGQYQETGDGPGAVRRRQRQFGHEV